MQTTRLTLRDRILDVLARGENTAMDISRELSASGAEYAADTVRTELTAIARAGIIKGRAGRGPVAPKRWSLADGGGE